MMFGNALTIARLKRAGRLPAISAFATLGAGGGFAADLRLRIDGTPFSMAEFERFLAARHERPASLEARKQLFQEFLRWNRAREHR